MSEAGKLVLQKTDGMLNGPDKLCSVCGDVGSGFYFNALVCLPCKSFFIRCTRVVTPNLVCPFDQNCEVTKETRLRCQSCRYKKCQNVGMFRKEKPEHIEPNDGQQVCRVCSDIANGTHFGVLTCEGCKKFFRRGIHEYGSYVCRREGSCSINPRNRNRCRLCRFKKCIDVGMSRNAIKMGRPRKTINRSNDFSHSYHNDSLDKDFANRQTLPEVIELDLEYRAAFAGNICAFKQSYSDINYVISQAQVSTNNDLSQYSINTFCNPGPFPVSTKSDLRQHSSFTRRNFSQSSANSQCTSSTSFDGSSSDISTDGGTSPNACQNTNTTSLWPEDTYIDINSSCGLNVIDNLNIPVSYTNVLSSPSSFSRKDSISPGFKEIGVTKTYLQNMNDEKGKDDITTSKGNNMLFHHLQNVEQRKTVSYLPATEHGLQQNEILMSDQYLPLENVSNFHGDEVHTLYGESRLNEIGAGVRISSTDPQLTDVNLPMTIESSQTVYCDTVALHEINNIFLKSSQCFLPDEVARNIGMIDVGHIVKDKPMISLEDEILSLENLLQCYDSFNKGQKQGITYLRWETDDINNDYWLFPALPFNACLTPIISSLVEKLTREMDILLETMTEGTSSQSTCIQGRGYDPEREWECITEHIQCRIIRNFGTCVEFLYRSIEGFSSVSLPDQRRICYIVLFQMLFIMACVFLYDPQTRRFRNFWDWNMDHNNPLQCLKKELQEFADRFHALQLNKRETSLLLVLIAVATDYKKLYDVQKLENLRQPYLTALLAYVTDLANGNVGCGKQRIRDIFQYIPKLRQLGTWHHKLMNVMKLELSDSVMQTII